MLFFKFLFFNEILKYCSPFVHLYQNLTEHKSMKTFHAISYVDCEKTRKFKKNEFIIYFITRSLRLNTRKYFNKP